MVNLLGDFLRWILYPIGFIGLILLLIWLADDGRGPIGGPTFVDEVDRLYKEMKSCEKISNYSSRLRCANRVGIEMDIIEKEYLGK